MNVRSATDFNKRMKKKEQEYGSKIAQYMAQNAYIFPPSFILMHKNV